MNHRGLFIAARIRIPIVFVGLGPAHQFLKSFATLGGLLALVRADLGPARSGGGARV